MESLDVAKRINLKIKELDDLKVSLPSLVQKKSETTVAYEKSLAREVQTLAMTMSVSIVDKVAKGNCADLKGDMDLAEGAYKNCLKIIDITEAQLNGYQSIFRYLSET